MPLIELNAIASARSGDKGEGSNVGVIAHSDTAYRFLVEALTEDVVRGHFKGINHGGVERFEAANMRVLNFLLEDSLGGGGSASPSPAAVSVKPVVVVVVIVVFECAAAVHGDGVGIVALAAVLPAPARRATALLVVPNNVSTLKTSESREYK